MKVLVIGASSFTGTHFCKFAREKGARVQEASLRTKFLYDAVDGYVVNFAALNVVAPSWDYPRDYMNVNVKWPITFAESAYPIKYVHVSTPEVYGSTTGWVTEDAPYNPSTPYAVSRAAAEMLLKCYHRQYGFPVVFTRSSNVYGPGQQLYRLIPKLIVSIKKGIKFPLEGGGQSSRTFMHVRDVCEATWRVMLRGVTGQAYHISSPIGYRKIHSIVEQICRRMGTTVAKATELAPERPGKDADYQLDNSLIKYLGWQPTIDLTQGIDEVIDWVNANWDTLQNQSLEYTHRP